MIGLKKYLMLLIICLLVFTGCLSIQSSGLEEALSKDTLKVHFLDVGQADSILVETVNNKTMLIDAGETKKGAVIGALNKYNIDKIDVLVATHPHSDHISEMADVIEGFEIGTVYMPKVIHTSKSFENMVNSIHEKGIKVCEARAGESFTLDDNVICDIVSPCSENYEGLNNWSAVIRLTYGESSFLFTGDAEELAEKEILKSGADISADVIKVGHHGSSTSSCEEFIERVSPKYAVISVGEDNDYGHPHEEVLKLFSDKNISVYRTDKSGTITAFSDGLNLSFTAETEQNAEKTTQAYKTAQPKEIFIGNKNSKKFHTETCSSLPSEKNRVEFTSKDEAVEKGYTPCGVCKP